MSIKGSRHRTQGEDFKRYQEAPYWKRIDNQDALEGKTKEELSNLNIEILEGEWSKEDGERYEIN